VDVEPGRKGDADDLGKGSQPNVQLCVSFLTPPKPPLTTLDVEGGTGHDHDRIATWFETFARVSRRPKCANLPATELVQLGWERAREVTTRADFAADEGTQLFHLPRWVVAAASAAQRDLAYRTTTEVESGFIAAANGRQTGNAFVAAVAEATLRIYDDPATIPATEFNNREAAISSVLDRVRSANQLLKAKADIADAMAYRRWLLDVPDIVISAARTGGFLGVGGKLVTASEQSFRDRLVLVLQS